MPPTFLMENLNKPRNQIAILLIVLLTTISLLFGRLFTTGSAIGGDAVYYFATLRSLAIDHDLDFSEEYKYFHNQTSNFTGNLKIPNIPDPNPITKKLPAKYPIGTAILLMPFFFLAHILVIMLQTLGFNLQHDGYNIIYQTLSALGSLIYAFLGVIIIYQLGRKIFKEKIAFFGTMGIWLATPLIYYMTMEPLNSQPLSFFSVSLLFYLWFISRKNQKVYSWIILGLVGGLMSMVRYQDALFMLVPIIDLLISKKIFNIFLLVFFAGLIGIFQLWANDYLFGSPFITSYTGIGFPYLTSPKIFYSLISFERGLLVWSPILIFSLIGLYWFVKRFRLVGGLLVFSFLTQLYIVSSWADPSQGDSFGNRILLNSNLIFALGLMEFIKKIKKQKIILIAVILFILANVILATLFIFRVIGQPY